MGILQSRIINSDTERSEANDAKNVVVPLPATTDYSRPHKDPVSSLVIFLFGKILYFITSHFSDNFYVSFDLIYTPVEINNARNNLTLSNISTCNHLYIILSLPNVA